MSEAPATNRGFIGESSVGGIGGDRHDRERGFGATLPLLPVSTYLERTCMTIKTVIAAALLFATPAASQDGLTGTWRADTSSAQIPKRPSIYALADGIFTCSSCTPAIRVRADGSFHPVAEDPYVDQWAIYPVDKTGVVMVAMKNGRIIENTVMRVEGDTLRDISIDSGTSGVEATASEVVSMRTRPSAPGAHPLSGSWQLTSYGQISDAALTMTIAVQGKTVRMSSPTGFGYTGTLGGPAVVVEGDGAGATAALRRIDPATIEVTISQGGKTMAVRTYSAQPGGTTMKVIELDKLTGTTFSYLANRQ